MGFFFSSEGVGLRGNFVDISGSFVNLREVRNVARYVLVANWFDFGNWGNFGSPTILRFYKKALVQTFDFPNQNQLACTVLWKITPTPLQVSINNISLLGFIIILSTPKILWKENSTMLLTQSHIHVEPTYSSVCRVHMYMRDCIDVVFKLLRE